MDNLSKGCDCCCSNEPQYYGGVGPKYGTNVDGDNVAPPVADGPITIGGGTTTIKTYVAPKSGPAGPM